MMEKEAGDPSMTNASTSEEEAADRRVTMLWSQHEEKNIYKYEVNLVLNRHLLSPSSAQYPNNSFPQHLLERNSIPSSSQANPTQPKIKMQFTLTTVLALAAAITGASASFKKACNAPYDVCGWTLADGNFGMPHITPTYLKILLVGSNN